MSKIAVVYSSLTGNTKQVAESIHEVLPAGTPIFDVEHVGDLSEYKHVFVGFWVDKSTADPKAADFIKSLSNKKIGLFMTIGAYPHTPYAEKCLQMVTDLFDKSNTVQNTFHCHGRIDPKLRERFKSFPPDHPHALTPERLARHKAAETHPDAQDLQAAKEFAQKTMALFEQE